MADYKHDVFLSPGDSISVFDRDGQGLGLKFAHDTAVYMSPEHEALLFQMLFERQFPRDAISHRFGDTLNVVGIIDSTSGAARPKPRLVGPTGGAA